MREDFKRDYRPMLYEMEDIEEACKDIKAVEYDQAFTIGDLTITLHDAGHIFGSAFVEVSDGTSRAVFSGDLGNANVLILRETAPLDSVDALVIESTYGNRMHEDESTRVAKLREAVTKTVARGGVLIIPAFAIERTQQLLFELHNLIEENLIPHVDIYLDSPLAIAATKVIESYPQYYDADAKKHLAMGDELFEFPGLHLTKTREESKTINDAPKPKVIIAGAGMMNGGRIRHHLIRYLSDPNSTVLVVGYQAEGTLGRQLYRGDKVVDVLGEHIQVHATITGIGAYSAHADQRKLLDWVRNAKEKPKHIYCTHGDEASAIALATCFEQQLGIPARVPRFGDTIHV